jgi:hypothetical protein
LEALAGKAFSGRQYDCGFASFRLFTFFDRFFELSSHILSVLYQKAVLSDDSFGTDASA